MQRTPYIRCKNDHVIAIPGSTSTIGRITNCLGRSAGDVDLFQLSTSEEPNEAAVGCPERRRIRRCPVSTSQRLSCTRVERSKPEHVLAASSFNNKRQRLPVR